MEEKKETPKRKSYQKPTFKTYKFSDELRMISCSQANIRISVKDGVAKEDADGAW